jgi:hypothetical protein
LAQPLVQRRNQKALVLMRPTGRMQRMRSLASRVPPEFRLARMRQIPLNSTRCNPHQIAQNRKIYKFETFAEQKS